MRFAYVKVLREVTEQQQVFEFKELSPDVQEKLIEKYRKDNEEWFWDFFDWEIKDSWEAIADLLDAKLRYEYQFWGYSYTRLDTKLDDEVLELEDTRAMAYIWNNWIEPNMKGKYLGHKKNVKKFIPYYSKLTKEFDCPLTGICYDMALWDAWVAWKDLFRENYGKYETTVDKFIDILEHKMTKMVMDEAEYRNSDEYIKEELQERGEYLADGSEANFVTVSEVA